MLFRSDFPRILKTMVKGKGPGKKAETKWDPAWAASLASAINGGQWTQVRKCKVVKWAITASSCQLCFSQPGTVSHRFECTASKPPKGFPPPPKTANLALQRIGPDRDELLKHRGILTLRIPSLPFRPEGSFK